MVVRLGGVDRCTTLYQQASVAVGTHWYVIKWWIFPWLYFDEQGSVNTSWAQLAT
jgi:hypothetical protein